MKRIHYIDNLRWSFILLLLPYHSAMAYNCWGEGNYIVLGSNKILSSFIVTVSPWYMTLLFLLAGMGARLSLSKRSYRQFARERISKLLVPLISGTLLVMPILTFFADKTNCVYSGSFLEHYVVFFTKWTDITGYDGGFSIGHLWFLLYLFVISIAALIIGMLFDKRTQKIKFSKTNVIIIVLLVLFSMLLIPAQLGGKSILTYFVLYLIGYYILIEESVIERLCKFRYIYLVTWCTATFFNVYLYLWSDIKLEALNTVMMHFSGCFGILTFLCFGKVLLNKANRITRYLTANSFLIYIFHFVWVVIFEYIFSKITSSTAIVFVCSVFCSFAATLISCEAVKRIPIVCRLFGMRTRKILN